MGLVSGTATRYDMKGLREDLQNQIYMISPEETPLSSSIGKGSCDQTLHEWQTDSLAAAVTTNAHLEGDDASFTTPAATVRVGNYTQISKKTGIISGTLERVNKAGRKSELAREKMKRGKELKLDIEATLFAAQAGDAGGTGTARTAAALNAWVKTNVDDAAGSNNPTYTAGVPAAVRTDGTQRAFTETILKSAVSSMWSSGGNVGGSTLYLGSFNKGVFSGFSGSATRNINITEPGPLAVIGAADVYVSDYGILRVIPSRHIRTRDGWIIDHNLLGLKFLRPIFTEPLAKTGDAEKFQMIGEWTLEVKQEAGLALCADLTTS
jgi:hypothetical protein